MRGMIFFRRHVLNAVAKLARMSQRGLRFGFTAEVRQLWSGERRSLPGLPRRRDPEALNATLKPDSQDTSLCDSLRR